MTDTPAKFTRKDKGELACDTTPRESLMIALSQVDEYSHAIIIMTNTTEGGGNDTRIISASPSVYHSAGMLADAMKGGLE